MSKCCNSCAYLKCNAGKPNPNPKDLNDESQSNGDCEWYSQKNIDEKWEATKNSGKFLTCHSTDKNYYGNDGHLTACLGFTYCVFIHIKLYELLGCNFKKYKDTVGHKIAMTRRGMGEAALSISMGSADLFGKFKIPRDLSESRPMRYPTGFGKTLEAFKKLYK